MPLIKFQSGVVIDCRSVMVAAVNNAAVELKLPDMLVTSGNDKVHSKGSLHYEDRALDFRTHHLADLKTKQAFRTVVKRRLGREYDVILEDAGGPNEHLHVEHDPK